MTEYWIYKTKGRTHESGSIPRSWFDGQDLIRKKSILPPKESRVQNLSSGIDFLREKSFNTSGVYTPGVLNNHTFFRAGLSEFCSNFSWCSFDRISPSKLVEMRKQEPIPPHESESKIESFSEKSFKCNGYLLRPLTCCGPHARVGYNPYLSEFGSPDWSTGFGHPKQDASPFSKKKTRCQSNEEAKKV